MTKEPKPGLGQSGGVIIHGGTVTTGGGDIVGRDKVVGHDQSRQVEEAFEPLAKVFNSLDPAQRAKALQELEKLKQEATKGEKSNDGIMADLVGGLAKVAPAAAGALASAFATPILGAIAGPVTKYVIGKLKGNDAIQA